MDAFAGHLVVTERHGGLHRLRQQQASLNDDKINEMKKEIIAKQTELDRLNEDATKEMKYQLGEVQSRFQEMLVKSIEAFGKEKSYTIILNKGVIDYNAASVDDICTEAGVSKGAFYHHFESKQALFLALLDGWLKTIDNTIDSAKDKTVPETFMQITEAFPYIFESAGDHLPMFLEFWLQASRDEEIWQASIAPYRRYHKYFNSLIKKGVQEGSFVEVDPEIASRLIVSMAMGLLLQSLLDPKGAKWEKVARDSTTLLVNSLLKR